MGPQHVGTYRGVRFQVGRIDPVMPGADLLIVGMPPLSVRPEASAIDAALSGTVSQLRAGGLFDGRFGETMILSGPPLPVRTRALLVMGTGDEGRIDARRLGLLTAIAMRAALRLGHRSLACLLGQDEGDGTPDAASRVAHAMMTGALKAIDAHAGNARTGELDWTFDIAARHVDMVRAQCRSVIDRRTA